MRPTTLLLALLLLPGLCQAAPPQDPVLVPVVNGGLNEPVAVRHAGDGSGRLFIVEQDGLIRIWRDGSLLDVPFLDVSPISSCCGERGLLGLDFHPQFASNGLFYIDYTDNNGDTVVAEYAVSAEDPDLADPASARIVLQIDQDFGNHNGGDLHFGPDGFLYIAMGDGGFGNDFCRRAQTLDPTELVDSGGPQGGTACVADANFSGDPDSRALLGKILRIDVDARATAAEDTLCGFAGAGDAPYGIPAGNPYAGGGDARCDEIWAYGLRNPFRFSFDRLDGGLYIGDVGQSDFEEVDRIGAGEAGVNFGWRCLEGSIANDNPHDEQGGDLTPVYTMPPCTGNLADPLPGARPPILEHAHPTGCSVSGGYRYRGAIDALYGTYVYGFFCTGIIWFASEDGGNWNSQQWLDAPLLISAFGEDEAGELYVVSYQDTFQGTSGSLHRFVTDRIFLDGLQ